MKIRPFKELIALSPEKLDETMAPIRARQVKARADQELCQIETQLITLETRVQEICTQKELNLSYLIDTLDEIALQSRRRTQYSDVLKQLFPDEKEA